MRATAVIAGAQSVVLPPGAKRIAATTPAPLRAPPGRNTLRPRQQARERISASVIHGTTFNFTNVKPWLAAGAGPTGLWHSFVTAAGECRLGPPRGGFGPGPPFGGGGGIPPGEIVQGGRFCRLLDISSRRLRSPSSSVPPGHGSRFPVRAEAELRSSATRRGTPNPSR